MLDQMMHQYRKGRFHGSDDEIYMRSLACARLQSRHRGDHTQPSGNMGSYPASGFPVAESYLTRDESDLV